MTVWLNATAADGAAVTLAELAEFVEHARVLGIDPASTVKATVSIRGRMKTVSLVDSGSGQRRPG